MFGCAFVICWFKTLEVKLRHIAFKLADDRSFLLYALVRKISLCVCTLGHTPSAILSSFWQKGSCCMWEKGSQNLLTNTVIVSHHAHVAEDFWFFNYNLVVWMVFAGRSLIPSNFVRILKKLKWPKLNLKTQNFFFCNLQCTWRI